MVGCISSPPPGGNRIKLLGKIIKWVRREEEGKREEREVRRREMEERRGRVNKRKEWGRKSS